MKAYTYEFILWDSPASNNAEWLSGPIIGKDISDEMRYLQGARENGFTRLASGPLFPLRQLESPRPKKRVLGMSG